LPGGKKISYPDLLSNPRLYGTPKYDMPDQPKV